MGSRTVKVGAEDVSKVTPGMPSFIPQIPISNSIGTEGNNIRSRISDFGALEQSLGFRIEDAVDLSRNSVFNSAKPSSQAPSTDLQFGALNKTSTVQKELQQNIASVSGSHRENWGESNMADASPRTDTSTDVDTDEKNQRFEMGQSAALVASDSSDRSKEKAGDQKTLRRLAQNREAARKSRLRKKAYVQQLENSRMKLTQLEQELQRARQQGIFISSSGDQSHSMSGNGALAFDVEYARWLEEHNRQINELRSAVNSHASDTELRTIVDNVTAHFDDIFRLKGIAAKADVFHILSGMWKTPAERCFMWIGGFRSSEVLKWSRKGLGEEKGVLLSEMGIWIGWWIVLLVNQLEPLTEQQLMSIYNLQQSSQQAEDALSQGMEALQQSLAETLTSGSPGPSGSSGNVANYMGQMAMAMGKLGTLEGFLRQADNLRQQTLQQMHRILTTRQSARALLAINDYFSRLRALSSLWLARPRE
ncbi:TGACG-sequence-specific DNA-binding protein TGA-2.1 [Vitis vinifera]|uniref:TGACG-sequence-specific DNA-binding protein TGA-2.1 n=1 Tax=Vitis vinifera TaxID=29760 RepID=A0A438I667_VITVI|nr:TGACG-sequence-specific DNA-binding protein TGA-2.1 [Vitis vinifera]